VLTKLVLGLLLN